MNTVKKSDEVMKAEKTSKAKTTSIKMSTAKVNVREYQKQVEAYLAIMMQVKIMFQRNIIDEREYAIIDTMFAEKYGISSCSIFRQNLLIKDAA